MFRKLALGLVAAGSLGIAAFTPTSASAYDGGPYFRGRRERWHASWMGMAFRGSDAHFRGESDSVVLVRWLCYRR